MTPNNIPARRLAPLLLWAGLASLVLDFVVPYSVATAHPGYSHVSQYMSELAVPGEPFATLMSAWWVAYGGLWLAFAIGLRASLSIGEVAILAGPALIALAGAGLGVGGGLYPCDAGCAGVTPSGQAHTLSALVGSVALVAAPFAFWISLRGRATAIAKLSLGFGIGGAAVFAVFLSTGAPDSSTAHLRGLWQRVFLAVYYVWLTGLALYALRIQRARRDAPIPG